MNLSLCVTVCEIYKKLNLMLNKAAFIWSKNMINSNIVHFYYT